MAWNEPGGPKNNDPWGNKNNDSGPPDLDEVIKKINDKFNSLFGGRKKPGSSDGDGGSSPDKNPFSPVIIAIVAVILVAVWAFSGIYTVDQGKQSVVLQFGAYKETKQAGIQWYMPLIQSYQIVDVSASRSVNLGGSTHEALMLTQDENIVEIKVAVQFKVSNPEHFLFNVRDPGLVLRQVSESAVREIVGQNKMDFILTEGRSVIAGDIGALAQQVLDRYTSGLLITRFTLQSANAPEQVQHAFEDVNAAREDKERFINEAEAYRNDILPKARGQAAKQTAAGEAYKAQVISESQGEVNRFISVLTEYERAPEVTRKRLYIDAMETVMNNSKKVMIDTQGSNNLLYLPLGESNQNQISLPASAMIPTLEQNGEMKQQQHSTQQKNAYKRTQGSRSRPPIQ